MAGRKLQPDELSLWHQVNAHTHLMRPHEMAAPSAALKTPSNSCADKTRKPKAHAPKDAASQSPPRSAHASPSVMDKKLYTRLRKGALKPEATLDLHGMKAAQAHQALGGFITGAHASGKRLVLVITGKGKSGMDDGPIPAPKGVLRTQVPQWLALPPLVRLVMQTQTAHQKHGGAGAYYVYLRKPRSNLSL